MNESPEALKRRLARIAWLLDSSIPLPGTRFRIGLDAIFGLLPGIGDAIGVVLSSYIVREAARAGVPRVVLARMAWNRHHATDVVMGAGFGIVAAKTVTMSFGENRFNVGVQPQRGGASLNFTKISK